MVSFLKTIDSFCGRMNAGLAAVAIVLSILVAAELTVRMPELFQQAIEAENATIAANGSF